MFIELVMYVEREKIYAVMFEVLSDKYYTFARRQAYDVHLTVATENRNVIASNKVEVIYY